MRNISVYSAVVSLTVQDMSVSLTVDRWEPHPVTHAALAITVRATL